MFRPLTNISLRRKTQVTPPGNETYLVEIDGQSRSNSRGEPLVAIVGTDMSLNLFSRDTFSAYRKFTGHERSITGVRFSPRNPNVLYSCSMDGTIRGWDTRIKSNKAQQIFTGYEGNVFTSFDVNCSDSIICAGTEKIGEDAYLMFWDCRSTNILGAYKESHSDDITRQNNFSIKQVKFHPTKANSLATGSTDGLVCVFDICEKSEDDALVTTLNSESSVSHIGWCGTNSEYLYCLTHTETLLIWDAVESNILTRFDDVRESVSSDQCSIDYLVDCFYHSSLKTLIVLAGNHSGEQTLLTIGKDKLHPVHRLSGGHSATVRCLHWNDQTGSLVTGGEDAIISLWQQQDNIRENPKKKLMEERKVEKSNAANSVRRSEKRGSPLKEPFEKTTKRLQRLTLQQDGNPYAK
ncbi:WD repeat-containing protein 89-like isoform X2 [Anneissia japonica]|uniref:WD repeat-containing protein 89-like isoform X2 n=1 Tax=Anneissia japonica TaxID=1529436 RepID=UPI0014255597|nr:WD repeat-containing protein 89-like isoform X2 [Anneissia japonica]